MSIPCGCFLLHTHIHVVEDKLKHIKMLGVNLSKINSNRALPNWEWLAALRRQELGERFLYSIEKVPKQREDMISLAIALSLVGYL